MSRVHLAVSLASGAVASGAERGGYAWSVGEYTTTTAPGAKAGQLPRAWLHLLVANLGHPGHRLVVDIAARVELGETAPR
jgi:hypothetical protein